MSDEIDEIDESDPWAAWPQPGPIVMVSKEKWDRIMDVIQAAINVVKSSDIDTWRELEWALDALDKVDEQVDEDE
jgi:hypothetical protein